MIEYPSPHSSQRHQELYNLFCSSSTFSNLTIRQEVPLKDLCESYPNGRDRVDWYIQELSVTIELHGRQHREEANFGGIYAPDSRKKFLEGKRRDRRKEAFLQEAGYIPITIWFDEPLNEDTILDKIQEACSE